MRDYPSLFFLVFLFHFFSHLPHFIMSHESFLTQFYHDLGFVPIRDLIAKENNIHNFIRYQQNDKTFCFFYKRLLFGSSQKTSSSKNDYLSKHPSQKSLSKKRLSHKMPTTCKNNELFHI